MKSCYGVIGGGAWGTALANMFSVNGFVTKLYLRDGDITYEINHNNTNNKYLSDILLDKRLRAYDNFNIKHIDRLILAIPTQKLRDFLVNYHSYIPGDIPVILCSKGIELTSGLFASQIVKQFLPNNKIIILSGPSFAVDLALSLPIAVTLACDEIKWANLLSKEISNNNFRCYSSDDIIGVQIGGALKNIYAIASGAISGCGLGESAMAAFITRAFAEMRRLGLLLGARIETLCGLSGLGDLMLTCNCSKSRNFSYGYALAKNLQPSNKLAEGFFTAKIALKFCNKFTIDLPLIEATKQLLEKQASITEIYDNLFARPLKVED